MNKVIRILLSVPKTVVLNFGLFPLRQAVKLPLFISYDTDVSVKGRVELPSDVPVRTAMIRFGFLCALACDTNSKSRLVIKKGGVLRFLGDAHIGHGTRLVVREGAEAVLGDNFAISSNSTVQCYKKVRIGRNVQFSWECLLMDSDTHKVIGPSGEVVNNDAPVIIGDNVWIGSRVTILKGVTIPDNTVIGACSLVVSDKDLTDHSVIAGQPARSMRAISGWKI